MEVARECGFLDGVPELLSLDSFGRLAPDKVLVLATGSQGEARAAMSRIVRGDHPVKLGANDLVIFSSRTIPGNEREVNAIVNALILQGADVMTDRDALVHCSGHPRRGEVAKLYQWLRPADRRSRAWRGAASARPRRVCARAGRQTGADGA